MYRLIVNWCQLSVRGTGIHPSIYYIHVYQGAFLRKKLAMLHFSACWHAPNTVAKLMGSLSPCSFLNTPCCRRKAVCHSWPQQWRLVWYSALSNCDDLPENQLPELPAGGSSARHGVETDWRWLCGCHQLVQHHRGKDPLSATFMGSYGTSGWPRHSLFAVQSVETFRSF